MCAVGQNERGRALARPNVVPTVTRVSVHFRFGPSAGGGDLSLDVMSAMLVDEWNAAISHVAAIEDCTVPCGSGRRLDSHEPDAVLSVAKPVTQRVGFPVVPHARGKEQAVPLASQP